MDAGKIFKFQKEEAENKISPEMAEKHIKAFLDYYDLSVDDMSDKEEKKAFNVAIKKLNRSICNGKIIIRDHEDGYPEIQQTLQNGSTVLTYGELSGKAKIAMKDNDDGDLYGKIYSVVGAITGVGSSAIEQLKGVDLSIAESIGLLFLKV